MTDAMIVSFQDGAAASRFVDAMSEIRNGHGITLHLGVCPAEVYKAAPNLLEACKAWLSWVEDTKNGNDPNGKRKLEAAIKLVLAAIKKAEGKQG